MPHYDASQAQCFLYTFKEGLLAKVAHDLKLRCTRFHVDVDLDAGALRAEFDTRHIEVCCARVRGQDAPSVLSARDRADVVRRMAREVLHTDRHPIVSFIAHQIRAAGAAQHIEGELHLHGRTRPLTALAMQEGADWVCRVDIHQPDFGIEPYRAALGALKVQAVVKVEVRLPRAAA